MANTNAKKVNSPFSGVQKSLRGKEIRFAISLIISTIIYIIIIYSSHYVPMFYISPIFSTHLIKVNVVDENISASQQIEESVSTSLSTRPISFHKFVDELLPPMEIPEPPSSISTQKEELARQAGTEALSRETEPLTPEEVIQSIEEKILTVEKESDKDSVAIARRLLPPAEENIMQPGETPSFSIPGTISSTGGTSLPSSIPPSISETMPISSQTGPETTGEIAQPPVILTPALETVEPSISLEETLEQEIIQQPIIEETKKEKENRQYEFWDDLLELQLKTYLPQEKMQGFFQLTISLKKDAKITPLHKQVAFVIDSSASIGQRKLDLTVRGVRDALQQLRDDDLFNIILFRERPTFFTEGYIKATPDNKKLGLNFLQQITSTGQTDVFNSMQQLIQIPTTAGLPNILWLCSDGKPTIGLRDTRAIIANLTLENQGRYEIYTFGGGKTVDRYLLELLAYLNRGFSVVKNDIEQIASGIPQSFQKIQNPILIDVSMDFGSIPRGEVYPFVLPNFYQDMPVTIYGKFDPKINQNFVFRLQGTSAGKKKEVIFRADLTKSVSGDFKIAQRWAFHKAFYIISRIIREGEKTELIQELQELKEKYNIKTTYTP
ncbi:MAG TPA: VWA domain-containing protein [Candidatus Hydrogenedens sp.]|nr:VWA domain-containing protein [Candidatus Hydrogenedens sp.]